jgi:hypothetical protein
MCAALLVIAMMARPRSAVMNTDNTSSVDLGQSDFGRDQSRELSQCRGSFLSSVTRPIGEMAGGSSISPQGLQASHGIPTLTQSRASARWLVPRHGRSGWFSQTQPVSLQMLHAMEKLHSSFVPATRRQRLHITAMVAILAEGAAISGRLM